MKISCVGTAPMAIARAADAVLTTLYEQWRQNLSAHLVISGGRSGADLAATIADGLKKPRPKVLHVWFADERFVEYADPNRNDTPLIHALAPVGCTLVVHRYGTPSQGTVIDAAKRYSTDLAAVLRGEPFTTVVISMGEDGHIASIFPNRDDSSGDVFALEDAPKMPPLRISLSLNRLSTTYECILLAVGSSKLPAIQGLLRKDPSLPATLLMDKTPITLITDQPIEDYGRSA